MPPTLEVSCDDPDCPLDMFELHYSYELSREAVGVEAFSCPSCGTTERLRELTYTYRDSR